MHGYFSLSSSSSSDRAAVVLRHRRILLPGIALAALLLLLACIIMAPASQAAGADPLTVRAGYYENPPKLTSDVQGTPKGIFPEILAEIARLENWCIEWIPGTWDEGIARLKTGTIDLMPDVAYSLDRAEQYEFSEEPVFINWAVLYARSGLRIDSLLDL